MRNELRKVGTLVQLTRVA